MNIILYSYYLIDMIALIFYITRKGKLARLCDSDLKVVSQYFISLLDKFSQFFDNFLSCFLLANSYLSLAYDSSKCCMLCIMNSQSCTKAQLTYYLIQSGEGGGFGFWKHFCYCDLYFEIAVKW